MKTNAIINLGVCAAAGFAVLAGCYETPAIDSQPDAEPQIVVDAKSSYTVASASADPVIFSISSNTPWYIENDAEGWCTVTPGASATSSLTEDITVTVDDNQVAEPRTATLTVTAEGVEEPVLVQIKQNALSKLEVSNVSGAIPQDGGDVTFTVLSDQEWKIVSNASWLTFSTNGEAGSDNAVTVTASAGETTNMRSATVRIETAEDFRPVTITQEGATVLKFSEADAAARTFAYGGESKTFHVEASMLWSVSCDDPDVTITPFEGTTSGDITVTTAAAPADAVIAVPTVGTGITNAKGLTISNVMFSDTTVKVGDTVTMTFTVSGTAAVGGATLTVAGTGVTTGSWNAVELASNGIGSTGGNATFAEGVTYNATLTYTFVVNNAATAPTLTIA